MHSLNQQNESTGMPGAQCSSPPGQVWRKQSWEVGQEFLNSEEVLNKNGLKTVLTQICFYSSRLIIWEIYSFTFRQKTLLRSICQIEGWVSSWLAEFGTKTGNGGKWWAWLCSKQTKSNAKKQPLSFICCLSVCVKSIIIQRNMQKTRSLRSQKTAIRLIHWDK